MIKTIETGMKRSMAMLAMMTLVMMCTTQAQAADAFKPAQLQQQNAGHVFAKNTLKKSIYHYVATTSGKARRQGKVNASGIVWMCQGTRCTISGPWPKPSVTACRKLASLVGPIRSYGRTGHYLSVNYMRQCNQRFVRKNSRKITGVASQAKGSRSGLGNQAVSGSVPQLGNSATSQAANRARGIGEAEARAKQARELQRMHDLGSPTDKVHGGPGASGTQDCSHSPNPAQCLRNNMYVGDSNNLPNGNSTRTFQACLQAGGNPDSCRQSGKGGTPGHLSAGPGSSPGAQYIPGRGQAQQDGGNSHGRFQGWNVRGNTPNRDGSTTDMRGGTYQDGTRVEETITTNRHGDVVSRTRTVTDINGRVIDRSEDESFNWNDGSSTTFHHENEGTNRKHHSVMTIGPVAPVTHGSSNQPAPEGGSRPADNCNWNPAMKKCVKPRHTGKGMTSQPGPNGQNPGAKPARTSIAPNIGVAGAINCGDAGSEACNRAGSGLSSGGRRLDHKDPGPAFGGPGTP